MCTSVRVCLLAYEKSESTDMSLAPRHGDWEEEGGWGGGETGAIELHFPLARPKTLENIVRLTLSKISWQFTDG